MGDRHFGTRIGPAWVDSTYRALVAAIVGSNLDTADLEALDVEQTNLLTSQMYDRFGDGRRHYWDSMTHFLNQYHLLVKEDCLRFRQGEEIIAPERQELLARITAVALAMDSCAEGQEEVSNFLEDSKFPLSLELRKLIFESLVGSTMVFREFNRLLARHGRSVAESLGTMREAREGAPGPAAEPRVTNEGPTASSSRRSLRDCSRVAPRDIIDKCLLNGIEDGLEKVSIPNKGMGVRATRNFTRNEYLVEYSGELITNAEAQRRNALYSADESLGSFLLCFRYNENTWWVDATRDNGSLGRWINHGRKHANAKLKTKVVNNNPRVYLVASREISAGEEILFDYGDRNPETIKTFPWLLE